jgi:hypothetical protein
VSTIANFAIQFDESIICSFRVGDNFMWKKFSLIIGLTALMAGYVGAQSISLGPQIGYYKSQDADEGNFMGGVTLRLKLAKSFGVEASINYPQENYANNVLTVRSWPIMVTG